MAQQQEVLHGLVSHIIAHGMLAEFQQLMQENGVAQAHITSTIEILYQVESAHQDHMSRIDAMLHMLTASNEELQDELVRFAQFVPLAGAEARLAAQSDSSKWTVLAAATGAAVAGSAIGMASGMFLGGLTMWFIVQRVSAHGA